MSETLLYKGDCLELMKNIKDKSIDMILADLPYGTTQCKWDSVIPFDKLWKQYHRVIKDNGAIVLFGQEPFSSYLRLSNIDEYKYDIVWDKVKGVGFLNAKKQPMRNHELISVFYKQQGEVYDSCGENLYDSTDRYPRSIQVFSTDTQNSSLHPTQKPIKLL